SRTAEGTYRLSMRFGSTRLSDGAGYISTSVQQPGEDLKKFAERSADAMRDVLRAYSDGKACVDQAATDRNKARSAAEKALKSVPNYGLAEYCLAALAVADDPVSEEAVTRYRNALITDSMSIPSYSGLAGIFFRR